jgi:hypothetical protein
MRKTWAKWAFLAVLVGVLAMPLFIIPSLGSAVFLSPDETATAVSARVFGTTGAMLLSDPVLKDAPWLHPRSYVTKGTAMVPVGFLGLPALLGIIWRVIGDWGLVLFTPLLALSVVYPLWRFTKQFGFAAQVTATATWLTLPTVVLYANRGLFPNLPAVCLAVWASYLVWEHRSHARAVLAGLCAGLALAMRPVEAVWMLVWFAAAWRFRSGRKPHRERASLLFAAGGCAVALIAVMIVAWRTYGSPFAVGYLLRDPVAGAPTMPSSQSVASVWPFGFHPRDVWYNLKTYVIGYLGPWFVVALIAMYAFMRRREARPFMFVGTWTLLAGLLMYGQSLYQDHVGVNVASVGNSFLRYLLTLAPLFAFSSAAVVSWLFLRLRAQHARTLTLILAGSLAILGVWTATQRDDEGILTSSQELLRYRAVRAAMNDTAFPNPIILSDRSDKIFFPGYRVASPLPPRQEILALVNGSPVPVLLYATTLDGRSLERWKGDGIQFRPIFQSLNETLYEMFPADLKPAP